MSLLGYILLIVLYVVAVGVLARVAGFNDWLDPPAPEEWEKEREQMVRDSE